MKKNSPRQFFLYLGLWFVGFSFSLVHAQPPYWNLAKSAGGNSNELGNSVAADTNGNILVTGYFSSSTITFGTTTLINAGSDDMFIVKYDGSGNVIWAKSAGGSADDIGYGVAVDGGGNSYVTGHYFGSVTFGTTTLTNTGSYDVFIVKYDATGNVVWAKNAGGSNYDYGYAIAVDGSGNSYVTGFFSSSVITFGTTTLTTVGSADIFVVKYNASGNVVWAKNAGGNNWDQGKAIAIDGSGNTYLTGYFSSSSFTFGLTTLINAGNDDIFVLKFDVAGNPVWAKSAGGSSSDQGKGIAVDSSGNSYVTGYFNSSSINFGATTFTNAGGYDLFVIKYNSIGNVVWAKNAGGGGYDYSFAIAVDGSGNSQVAGYFYSPSIAFDTATLTNVGGSDIFVVKYDTSGDVVWAKRAGNGGSENCIGIALDSNGNSYITGSFTSGAVIFGTITISTLGASDMLVARLGNCPYIVVTSNTPICTGATINLTSSAIAGATYSWIGPNAFSSSLQNPAVPNAQSVNAGTYTCNVTVSSCTTANATTTVVVNNTPTVSITPSGATTFCTGGNVTLTASGGTTYFWNTGATTSSIVVSASGSYTVTGTTSGCSATSSPVVVAVNTIPGAPSLSSNSPVCIGNNLNLTAGTIAGATYSWSGPNSFSSSLQNPIITSAASVNSGAYSCMVTVSSCTSTAATTVVTVNPIPSSPSLSSNTPVCSGNTINLTAGTIAGATYSWSGPNSFSSSIQNPAITGATTSNTGTYSCTVTVSSCTSLPATTSVTVNTIPSAPTVSSNTPVCVGTALNLTAATVAGATYHWTGPNSFSSTLQNPTITSAVSASAGVYNCYITISACNSLVASTTVVVLTSPSSPGLNSNSPVCLGATLNLIAATISGATYHWTGPNGFTSTTQNPSITNYSALNAGLYNCYVTVSGCNSNASGVTVTTKTCTIAAPTATTSITQHTATIHWTAAQCVSGYQIYYKRTQYTAWQYINVGAAATSYTLTNLQNNYNVQWKIRTKCLDNNYSGWSATQTFHTMLRLANPNEVVETSKPAVLVFPNPTDGWITIQLDQFSDEVSVAVVNVMGQLMQQSDYNTGETAGEIKLNLTGLAAGIYFVTILDGDEKYPVRVMKEE